MANLNFFIKPQTAEIKERLRLAHTVRGLAWYISCPPERNRYAHPLDLPYVLGLSSQTDVDWWKSTTNEPAISKEVSAGIVRLCAESFTRSIDNLDMNTLSLRFKQYPPGRHGDLLTILRLQLEATYSDGFFNSLSHFERLHIMQVQEHISGKIPTDVLNKLSMSLASLEAALLAKDPLMPQHLRSTHQLLISYPETVHLLDDNEIASIIDAAEIHTKTQIIKDTVTKGTGTKKKIAAGDL